MRRVAAIAVWAVLGGVAALGPMSRWAPAGAHTAVRATDPERGAVVAAPVDTVTITFLSAVRPSSSIAVTGPDGAAVEVVGDARTDDDGLVLVQRFAPMETSGPYTVSIDFVAADGVAQHDAYQFTVEASGDGGASNAAVVVTATAVGVLLAAGLLWSRRRARTRPHA